MSQETLHSDASHTYDCSDLSDRFHLLLEGLDFQSTVESLGLSKWHHLKRKKAVNELRALCVALWKVALEKSFPTIAAHCFSSYLANLAESKEQKKTKEFIERINIYTDILISKGDSDFYEVATYIVDIFTLGTGDQKRYRLQLSLDIRKLYNIIFEKLI